MKQNEDRAFPRPRCPTEVVHSLVIQDLPPQKIFLYASDDVEEVGGGSCQGFPPGNEALFGWCFQIFFLCSPLFGEDSHFDYYCSKGVETTS